MARDRSSRCSATWSASGAAAECQWSRGITTATEDQLKAFGAATASTGAVALFHVLGVTPEAPDADEVFGGRAPEQTITVTTADLRRAWTELSTRRNGKLAAVCIGTPHFSIAEFWPPGNAAQPSTCPRENTALRQRRPMGV